MTPASVFRQTLKEEAPAGDWRNQRQPCPSGQARRLGKAIYLSGGGVAAGSLDLPDLGINTMDDVLIDTRRITDVCDLPLLVDIDTGLAPRLSTLSARSKA